MRGRRSGLLAGRLTLDALRACGMPLKAQTNRTLHNQKELLLLHSLLYFEGRDGGNEGCRVRGARAAARDAVPEKYKSECRSKKRLFDVGASFGRVPPHPIPN